MLFRVIDPLARQIEAIWRPLAHQRPGFGGIDTDTLVLPSSGELGKKNRSEKTGKPQVREEIVKKDIF